VQVSDLRRLTLREIAIGIRDHRITPTELVTTLLDQIRRTDGKLKAYVTVCAEDALEQAEAAELELQSGHDLGPLHGIPVSIKDNFETKGIRTTCGSKLLKNYIPARDCTVVNRLKQSGAIMLGKTNTHEFALGVITPPTRNPWSTDRIPGGSSGGSAVAVAVASAAVATGSDTAGSIRIPSSFCGAVGLKPTYGLVSRAGVIPECWSLDHIGPIARRVDDAALLLSVMAGYDVQDPNSSEKNVPSYLKELGGELQGMTIGIPKNHFFDRCDEEVEKAVFSAVDLLATLGCKIVEFDFPHVTEVFAACTAIDLCESSTYHERNLAERADEFSPDVRAYLDQGFFIPATYYINALRMRAMIFQEVVGLFKRFDVIITPTEPIVAPLVETGRVSFDGSEENVTDAMVRYTYPFNLMGLPALSIPCGFSKGRLPIGLQIIGKPFCEATVLKLGNAYEQATTWHSYEPDV